MTRSKKSVCKPKIYQLIKPGQEVHFPGDNTMVAVCWNTENVTKTIKGPDGLKYTAQVQQRLPKALPYISFMTVRKDPLVGHFYRTDESPVDGGMGLNMASDAAKELTVAIEYFKTLGK